MTISTRIICLHSTWKEILVQYIKFKDELGVDSLREYCPEIYWKDKRFLLFEETFKVAVAADHLNKCLITFCETIGNPQIEMKGNSFEGSIYSSISDMLDGNSKAFIYFYGEAE